jgi:hypothetical protein
MMPGRQTRRLLFAAGILLLGCNAGFAQISTMGTTAMGLPTTPGAILISPLNGPGPFSAVTQPGTAGTTLAPVPLASDPATPGTVVTCAMPTGQIAPGTPTVPVASLTTGTSGATALAPLPTAMRAIPTSIVVASTTGTISPTPPVGASSTTVCSFAPGGPPTNGAALPLSTPQISAGPPPGTIQPDMMTQLATTSLDPATTVVPTPNTSVCAENMTMNLMAPATMAPANATGAAATPGVSSPGPAGC